MPSVTTLKSEKDKYLLILLLWNIKRKKKGRNQTKANSENRYREHTRVTSGEKDGEGQERGRGPQGTNCYVESN